MTKKKCMVLLSGGLDSRLAVKIMQEQCEVMAVYFKLPFCKYIEKEIKEFCNKEKIKLKIFDCTKGKLFQEYLKIIRKPKYKRGVSMNPCIDCRIFILKKANSFKIFINSSKHSQIKAKEFANKKNIEIIVTGEVLNERPMSQTKKSMELIEKESGLKGKLLRPLSAKLLNKTNAENKKLVDRKKFYAIQGRKREKQIALAKKFKISYPSPAGGCLLCEKLYCEKLKKILDSKLTYRDIQVLKIGRHFKSSQIILGRNKKENKLLENAKNFSAKNFGATKSSRAPARKSKQDFFGEKRKYILIIPKQPGPTALIKNKKYEKKAKELIKKYSKHKIKDFEVRK